jgi:hypothetical protein
VASEELESGLRGQRPDEHRVEEHDVERARGAASQELAGLTVTHLDGGAATRALPGQCRIREDGERQARFEPHHGPGGTDEACGNACVLAEAERRVEDALTGLERTEPL